uniref:CAP domain-containing protein (inferred by orthology to a zebrafish protein) n=1 Tax=Strongyloides venezuelensis TaxID=75913 RepID=A0A0K0G1Z4_STRVS
MNLLLIILIFTSVTIHVVIGGKKKIQNKEEDEGWIHEKPISYSEGMAKKKGSRRHSHKKNNPPYVIEEVVRKGERGYLCNRQFFRTLGGANECLQKLKKKHPNITIRSTVKPKPPVKPKPSHLPNRPNKGNNHLPRPARPVPLPPTNQKPNSGIRPVRPPPQPPTPKPTHRPHTPHRYSKSPVHHKDLGDLMDMLQARQKQQLAKRYRDFSIKKYLSRSSFSNRVYKSVWSECNFLCFYENRFSNYKSRALTQINILRVHHNVHILKENYHLDALAQKFADKMASKNTLLKIESPLYGIVVGIVYYPAASVLVTKWYDERFGYSYFLSKPRHGTQSFTQMVWKSTKYIGIGAAKRGDLLFVTCFFYPKGNIKGQYRKNVLKKKSRWFGK